LVSESQSPAESTSPSVGVLQADHLLDITELSYIPSMDPFSTEYLFFQIILPVRNEEVLLRVNEQTNILHEISKRKANRIGHILGINCVLQRSIEREDKRGYRRDRKTRKKT